VTCFKCGTKIDWQYDFEIQCPSCKQWWEVDWDEDYYEGAYINGIEPIERPSE